MHILNQVQVNLIYNTNRNLFLWIEIFISKTDLISGGRGRPWGIFFGFYKTRHILLSNGANCTLLRAVILTQYRCVMDRRTDGIAVANTALAVLALRAL